MLVILTRKLPAEAPRQSTVRFVAASGKRFCQQTSELQKWFVPRHVSNIEVTHLSRIYWEQHDSKVVGVWSFPLLTYLILMSVHLLHLKFLSLNILLDFLWITDRWIARDTVRLVCCKQWLKAVKVVAGKMLFDIVRGKKSTLIFQYIGSEMRGN